MQSMPERLVARLEDGIFERLPNGTAAKFPKRFLAAIKPGADLSLVGAKFMVWLLIDPKDGVLQYARPDGAKAIKRVAELYQRKIDGKRVQKQTWKNAAYAADAADAARQEARDKHAIKMANKLIQLLKEAE